MPSPTDVVQIADPLVTDQVDATTAHAEAKALLVSPIGTKDQILSIAEFGKLVRARDYDPRTKLDKITVTDNVDLDAHEVAIGQLADLVALRGRAINVEDYGAVSGMLPDTPEGKTQALANADAIAAAHVEAVKTWEGFPGFGPNGVLDKLGGSIYRYLGAKVFFPGSIYQIAKPISIPNQGGFCYWDCNNCAIARYGDEGEFDADYPGRWGIEFGQDHTDVSVFTALSIHGLTLAGFTYGMRIGIAPNNVNMGYIRLVDVDFVGPDGMHPGTIGLRVFNRSASLLLERCMSNCYDRAIDIQSVDRVTLMHNFRIQVGEQIFDSGITRPANEAQIVLHHGRLKVCRAIFNPPHFPTGGLPNIDTQRHFWIWAKEFDGWEANKKYLVGDVIYHPYQNGATPVYWGRLNYTASSGATWENDRSNWQVVDSMVNWKEDGESGLQPGDVRRATHKVADGGDGVTKFWVWVGDAGGSYPAAASFVPSADWTVAPNSGAAVTTVGVNSSWSGNRTAGEPISAWNYLDVDEHTLFGAETGGLTPILWDYPQYRQGAYQGVRKLPSYLRLANNTCNTARAYSAGGEQPTDFIPAVLLRAVPNQLVITGNHWSSVTGACAAMWDPTLASLPAVPITTSSGWPGPFRCKVAENIGGSLGTAAWSNAQPHTSYGWYSYGPNWAPPELLAPILNAEFTTGVKTLDTITGGSGYTNGTYNAKQATYVSGPTATTYPKLNVTVSGGAVTSVTISDRGKGFYSPGTVLTVSAADLGGTGSGFSIPVSAICWQDFSAWANGVAVENGELRRIDAESKIYRSRFTRTTGATWDATEKAFWTEATDLVEDSLPSGPYNNLYVGNAEFLRWCCSQRNMISGLHQLEPGRIVTIFFQAGGSQVTHNASILKLKGGASVTNVAAGSVMAFTSINGVAHEVYRNF